MNVRTISIRQSRRFLGVASSRSAPRGLGILHQGFHICFCSQWICLGRVMAWDGPGCATGLWHAPAWWQGGMAGVLQCPALFPTYAARTWKNKLLPSPAHVAGVREQRWWKLCPVAREQSQEDMEFSQSACTFPTSQDHPLRWLRHNQHQERASPPEWFRAIKSGTN